MDILKQCAEEFDKLSNYNYVFDVGKSGKKFQINLSCLQEDFTHIVGLDHLHDITFDDIKSSKYYNVPFAATYNSESKKEYTITDRIKKLGAIEQIFDNMKEKYINGIYQNAELFCLMADLETLV